MSKIRDKQNRDKQGLPVFAMCIFMLMVGLVLIWELDMNFVPTLVSKEKLVAHTF